MDHRINIFHTHAYYLCCSFACQNRTKNDTTTLYLHCCWRRKKWQNTCDFIAIETHLHPKLPKNQRFLYTKHLIIRYFERHLPNSNQLSRSFNVLFLVKINIPHGKSVQNCINWFYVVHCLWLDLDEKKSIWIRINFKRFRKWHIVHHHVWLNGANKTCNINPPYLIDLLSYNKTRTFLPIKMSSLVQVFAWLLTYWY